MFRIVIAVLTTLVLALAACGDDGGGNGDSAATGGESSTTPAPTGDTAGDGGSSATEGGSITIDGTTHTFVADLQCGIFDSAEQYYISGTLPDVEGGELSYSRDENTHRLTVDLSDVSYRTSEGDMESTIDGNVVTGTATLTPDDRSEPVEAEFRFECG